MSTNFPTDLDDNATITEVFDNIDSVAAAHQNNKKDAIVAIETKLGINSSSTSTSLDYKIKNPLSINPGHHHTTTTLDLSTLDADTVDGLHATQLGSYNALLGSVTLGSAAIVLTISGISQNYKNLTVEVIGGVGTSGVGPLNIRFNGDIGNSYWAMEEEFTTGVAVTEGAVVIGSPPYTSARIGYFTGTSVMSNSIGYSRIRIFNYNTTNTYRGYMAHSTAWQSNSSCVVRKISGGWNSTSAITSLSILDPAGSNLVAGLKINVWGSII